MAETVPPDLRDEQHAVEAQIRAAFKGVSRNGGTSWYQSVIIDNGEESARRHYAQINKAERGWEDLVDDPDWDHEPGIGGFNFLDPIGFAYYIAPAMIRCTREGGGEFVGYALQRYDLMDRLSPVQERAIARFVRFMIAVHDAQDDDIYGRDWKNAYQNYWAQVE